MASDPVSRPVSSASLRFGEGGRFELQTAERRLLVDGKPAALGGRAIDLLATLAAEPQHLLTKSELLERVWPGLVVEEANLHVQISALRKLLGGQVIATVPGRGYRFSAELQARSEAAPAAPSPAAPPPGPPPVRLFGRDADLATLETALREGRGLVTLVGSSGVGKTSLARAAAQRWPTGHAWVDLGAVDAGVAVIDVVARALGLQPGEGDPVAAIRGAWGSGATLLVLDNAEHLLDACAGLIAQMRPLPAARLLVTSQVPLAVEGEQVLRIEPLADAAVALLIDRIRAADHRFDPEVAPLPQLQAICRQLDGLPLALEMAAARVPTLGLQGVRDALEQRFALLTRGRRDAPLRHRTLHHALDWSYRLLDAPAQRLLRALGVFTGGFTLDLAVDLMADGPGRDHRWDTIDALATLVDRSLVAVSADNPPRYRLLETMRAYAIEQLATVAEPGEDEQGLRDRHATVMTALFATYDIERPVDGPRCLAEMENARAAAAWCTRTGRVEAAARLTALVLPPAVFSLWRHEASQWLFALEPAMRAEAGARLPLDTRAAWWTAFARVLSLRRDEQASAVARHAHELQAERGDPRGLVAAGIVWVRSVHAPGPELDLVCEALQRAAQGMPDASQALRLRIEGTLGMAARTRGDLVEALRHAEAEHGLALELGWSLQAQTAESNAVDRLNALGRYPEAVERGLALAHQVDDDNGNLPWVMSGLLEALTSSGRLEEAASFAVRAWNAYLRFDECVPLLELMRLALAQERFASAARLMGHVLQALGSHGAAMDAGERRQIDATRAAIVAVLGEAVFDRLLAEGRQIGDEGARRLAVTETLASAPA